MVRLLAKKQVIGWSQPDYKPSKAPPLRKKLAPPVVPITAGSGTHWYERGPERITQAVYSGLDYVHEKVSHAAHAVRRRGSSQGSRSESDGGWEAEMEAGTLQKLQKPKAEAVATEEEMVDVPLSSP